MELNAEQSMVSQIDFTAGLTQQQAEWIYQQGKGAVVFALLALSKLASEQKYNNLPSVIASDPSTPSAQKPVFTKPNVSDRRRHKKPGRKDGHKGSRREVPTRIDRIVEHRAKSCPHCGCTGLQRRTTKRKRVIEDIPEDIRVETVEHQIYRDWCPKCEKIIEPAIMEALPNSTIGNGLLVLSAWLHFALGATISQILAVFNFHLQFKMSAGGLVQMWHRLADILRSWYEEITQDIQKAGVLHGDETGWRVNGKTHWLWCFTSRYATIFVIERSRAGPVVLEFIKECFAGVFVSDFWYAYNVLTCLKQKCLAHLLRELKHVEQYKDSGGDWPRFSKKLKRLIHDAIRLRKRKGELNEQNYRHRCERMTKRLKLLIEHGWSNKEARRLIKRLRRHQDELFTFLQNDEVPYDNNFGERSIRGAVIMRKNSYNNRSEQGAITQSVLMSVFFTIKQRGLNPVETVKKALKIYIETGNLPMLADIAVSNG